MKRKLLVGVILTGILVIASLTTIFTILIVNYWEYEERGPIIIESDLAFKHADFPGEGTEENPYIIERYNITTTQDYAIKIEHVTKHFIIRDCLLKASTIGIYLTTPDTEQVKNKIQILNNICIDSKYGMWVGYGNGAIISNNRCENNTDLGIIVGWSSNVLVTDNICNSNGEYGLVMKCCYDSTVSRNTCNNNGEYGLYGLNFFDGTVNDNSFYENKNGIYLWGDDVTFSNNIVIDSEQVGIHIEYGGFLIMWNQIINNRIGIKFDAYTSLSNSDKLIHHNVIRGNIEYGIRNDGANNITIHHNSFIENNHGGFSQAFDSGLGNIWYSLSVPEGNYWSDWTSGSYWIDGLSGYADLYPMDTKPVS